MTYSGFHDRSKLWMLTAGAATLVLLTASCTSTARDSQSTGVVNGTTNVTAAASTGGELRIARSLPIKYLNPLIADDANGSLPAFAAIYDQLVEYMPGSYDIQPGLASSWEASSDNTMFTFHLRDATFSNGDAVTSADVKYTLDRQRAPSSPASSLFATIKSVDTPDAHTVVITVSQPLIALPSYLATLAGSIVDAAVMKRIGDKQYNLHPIGSGAFVLSTWSQGQELDLARNPNYWRKGQPYLDKVRITYVPDDNTRILQLESGTVDAIDTLPLAQVKQVSTSGKAVVRIQDSTMSFGVNLNHSVKALSSKAVRQALAYATPLKQIQQTVFAGQGELMNAIFPKLKYNDAKVKPYSYDLSKAKNLMQSSGFGSGFSLTILVATGDSVSKAVGQVLQASWAQIGVTVNLQQFDLGTLFTKWSNGDYQAIIFGPGNVTSDITTPDEFANIFLTSYDSNKNAFSWYNNPAIADLATQAIHASSTSEQAVLYPQLQRQQLDDLQTIPMIFLPWSSAFRPNVVGFQYVLVGWWRLEQVSVKK